MTLEIKRERAQVTAGFSNILSKKLYFIEILLFLFLLVDVHKVIIPMNHDA